MSRHHPTLHRLCHLFPWAGYWRPQPMAPRIPMVPRKAPVIGFGSAMAGSPVWEAKWRCIKKIEGKWCLGLRWPTLWRKKQQSNRSRRPRWEGCWRGDRLVLSVWGGVIASIWAAIRTMKKNEIILHLGLRWPSIDYFTHNNQPKKIRVGVGW